MRMVAVLAIMCFVCSCREETMKTTNQPYTVGVWIVNEGMEDKFVARWESFAAWTAKNQRGAMTGYLLRDADHPGQFLSFGGWGSEEAVKEWRARPEFKQFAADVKSLCKEFRPQSYMLVATSDSKK